MSAKKTKVKKSIPAVSKQKTTVRRPRRKKVSISPHDRTLSLIDGFLNDAECAQDTFNIVVPALKAQDNKTFEDLLKTVTRLKKDTKSEGPQRTRVMRHLRTLTKYSKKLNRSQLMFRGNALVGLVSRYDEFLASLLKSIYRENPSRSTSPDKSLTYDEILTLDSLENVVELFIAKDIEGFLRESHDTQLALIDRDFKIGLVEKFSGYKFFVEIMERRNLLVHAGGVTSKYYIKKCKDVGYTPDLKPEVGNILEVTEEYFKDSVLCLSEVSIRLGYALACRVYPDQLKDVHSHLLETVGFPLLMSEDWELAYRLFSFVLEWPEKYIPEDSWKRYYAINEALALNHLGKHDAAITLLDNYDWSTQSSQLLLANSVLRHQWVLSEQIMSKMDGKNPFEEDHFRTWPIFKEFRETKEFRRAYKAIYGKRFVIRLSVEEKETLKRATESS